MLRKPPIFLACLLRLFVLLLQASLNKLAQIRAPTVPNTSVILKLILGFFWTVFSSSDRRQYSRRPLSSDLRVTSLTIPGGIHGSRVAGLSTPLCDMMTSIQPCTLQIIYTGLQSSHRTHIVPTERANQ
jgi:hypothetical protein